MTIAQDGSPESGWVYDGNTIVLPGINGYVWRYGTERPCNLVGRYVTIFADYSSIATPYEIGLCQWGVMGNRIPILDEVIEQVSSVLVEELEGIVLKLGQPSEWDVAIIATPEITIREVKITPDSRLAPYLVYEPETSKVYFNGDLTDESMIGQIFQINYQVIFENGLEANKTQTVSFESREGNLDQAE